MSCTKEEAKRAFRDAGLKLLSEICAEDKIQPAIAEDETRQLRGHIDKLIEQFEGSIGWDTLCLHFTAEQLSETCANLLRPQFRAMIASRRPS